MCILGIVLKFSFNFQNNPVRKEIYNAHITEEKTGLRKVKSLAWAHTVIKS